MLRTELAFAVIKKHPRLCDQIKNLSNSLVVSFRKYLELWNGKPSFGTSGQSRKLLGVSQHQTCIESGKMLGELDELLSDWLYGMPLRITIVGFYFFVCKKR